MRISDWSSDVCSSDLLHGETHAVRLIDGRLEPMIIVPEEAGLMRAPVSTLKGGGPEENAERLKMLLMGYAFPEEAHVVALNAGIGRASCRERGCTSV